MWPWPPMSLGGFAAGTLVTLVALRLMDWAEARVQAKGDQQRQKIGP